MWKLHTPGQTSRERCRDGVCGESHSMCGDGKSTRCGRSFLIAPEKGKSFRDLSRCSGGSGGRGTRKRRARWNFKGSPEILCSILQIRWTTLTPRPRANITQDGCHAAISFSKLEFLFQDDISGTEGGRALFLLSRHSPIPFTLDSREVYVVKILMLSRKALQHLRS